MKIDPPIRLNKEISIISISKYTMAMDRFCYIADSYMEGIGYDRVKKVSIGHTTSMHNIKFNEGFDYLHFEWNGHYMDQIKFLCFYDNCRYVRLDMMIHDHIKSPTMLSFCYNFDKIDFNKPTKEILEMLKFIYL